MESRPRTMTYQPRCINEVSKLCELFFLIWESGSVPQEFKDDSIVHLYKHKGSRCECNNHGGISLLCIAGKTLGRVILNRLNNAFDSLVLHESQCGFRVVRSTVDMIFSLSSPTVDGKALKTVTFFTFLGSIVSNYANMDKEIESRIKKANFVFEVLPGLLVNPDKSDLDDGRLICFEKGRKESVDNAELFSTHFPYENTRTGSYLNAISPIMQLYSELVLFLKSSTLRIVH
ncbi:Hypothetical predicted protein [Octopus vulgaris]|uniref:Reverse transcriptase domain-containing protein n=1 Tax=Octopus vulgaris TaxID=6645 RepID=A0AA36AL33_OCTVU|nr:Hypothetical predicted protein [Octopus vulgaris]